MNVEHRTSNVEHRIMYSTIYNKDKAKRLPRSTLNVRCSMFKLLHLKLRLNLHITLKLCIKVRSSEFKNLDNLCSPARSCLAMAGGSVSQKRKFLYYELSWSKWWTNLDYM